MVSFNIVTVLSLVALVTPAAAFAPKSYGLARPTTVRCSTRMQCLVVRLLWTTQVDGEPVSSKYTVWCTIAQHVSHAWLLFNIYRLR